MCSSTGGQYCIIKASGIITPEGGRPAHSSVSTSARDGHLQSVKKPDAVIIQFWLHDDEHRVYETCRGI